MTEQADAEQPPIKARRRRRQPWREYVVVVKDPHLGDALVGKRGFIDGWSGGGAEPFRYRVKIEGANESYDFTRDQLQSTGEPVYVPPPRPWTRQQIETFLMDPPEAVFGIHHSILRKHARPADVIKLLRESPDPQVRRAVCYHIRQTSLKSGRDAVLAALFDPSPDVRLSAADAYGRVGRSEDFLILKAAYKLDRRPRFRRRIVFALGEVQCQAAAPFLIELLMLGQCRLDVIESLGELRGPEVRAELAAALEKESDSGWRRAIEDAIELIDARARRDKFEAIGKSAPRPLTAEQIERLVLDPPSDIRNLHLYLQINAPAEELQKVLKTAKLLNVRNTAAEVLHWVRCRDKRGY